jgi:hypothetical protein
MEKFIQDTIQATTGLIQSVEDYILGNPDWLYYFVNPKLETPSTPNAPLYKIIKEHPECWKEYVDLRVTAIAPSFAEVLLQGVGYDVNLKRYINIEHFDETVARIKSLYKKDEDFVNNVVKNIKDEIAAHKIAIRALEQKLQKME